MFYDDDPHEDEDQSGFVYPEDLVLALPNEKIYHYLISLSLTLCHQAFDLPHGRVAEIWLFGMEVIANNRTLCPVCQVLAILIWLN